MKRIQIHGVPWRQIHGVPWRIVLTCVLLLCAASAAGAQAALSLGLSTTPSKVDGVVSMGGSDSFFAVHRAKTRVAVSLAP